MFNQLKLCGVPPMFTLENGECDGTKAMQAWEEGITRKGRFMDASRVGVGVLQPPRRVLLVGTSAGADPTQRAIVREWLYLT